MFSAEQITEGLMRFRVPFYGGLTIATQFATVAHAPALPAPQPVVAYHVRIDSTRHDLVQVKLHIEHAPSHIRLAMKRHPDYDARFWRYLEFSDAAVVRLDTALWEVTLRGGTGDIHYALHLPPPAAGPRASWRSVVRDDGALLNSPDILLYLPDLASGPTAVDLDIPRSWRVATSLARAGNDRRRVASNAAEVLDSPILLGALREWTFRDADTRFAVDYWPLPDAAPFDTAAFVDELRRLAHAALGIFGGAPTPRYDFLIQDGAGDALEHRASVTIGVPSADLARNPRAHVAELTHEFFHTWVLVAIHPDSYGELTYLATRPTPGLWWGEGVVLHYADVLPRRAGVVDAADSASSRAARLVDLLSRYLAAPWRNSVSPAAASLAFGNPSFSDPNATGGYYMQGELLGEALDAHLRDSTHERRTLDDVFRALYAHRGRRVSEAELESITDSVCGCRLNSFFATQVRTAGTIDLRAALARLGWRMVVDTIAAVDGEGAPLADLRIGASVDDTVLRLVISIPDGAWSRAGVRSGDVLVSMNGAHPATFADFYTATHRLRVGDTATLTLGRGEALTQISVRLVGYDRPRVRLVDVDTIGVTQRVRRARWLAGW